jgi:dihydropteroate synthase
MTADRSDAPMGDLPVANRDEEIVSHCLRGDRFDDDVDFQYVFELRWVKETRVRPDPRPSDACAVRFVDGEAERTQERVFRLLHDPKQTGEMDDPRQVGVGELNETPVDEWLDFHGIIVATDRSRVSLLTPKRRRPTSTDRPTIVFVTGKLAAPAVREVVGPLGDRLGFSPHVAVQKISVAALMTVDWLIGKLQPPPETSRVILPGSVVGDTAKLSQALGGVLVEKGPWDARDLPSYFAEKQDPIDLTEHNLEILAEINHANRLQISQIVWEANQLREAGADVIDLGCTPGERWEFLEESVKALIADGFRVSIDSFDPEEIARATGAGAEIVLSVNKTNREHARKWNAEVVVVPDSTESLDACLSSLAETVASLEAEGVRYRLDPILDPIGFGFADSLGRYLAVRERFPNARMMMGVGNLTEMTEADTAGVNALLAGFCAECRIDSVLTTQVAPWTTTAVAELALARRIMHAAIKGPRPPKRLDTNLVMLRDSKTSKTTLDELKQLQTNIRDDNYRLFIAAGELVALNAKQFETDYDAFRLFERLGVSDPSHAFYLGWELSKASIARQLGKRYEQDRALRWGLSTLEEKSHRGRGKEAKDDGSDR